MGDSIANLSVIKAEKDEQDRSYSKTELSNWVQELPDDVTGFAVCVTKHLPDGGVWTKTHNAGNSVMLRFEALHIAIVDFMQFQGKRD